MSDISEIGFSDYYNEVLYMTADVETGVLVNRSGRRMIALTDDFLIGFHKALRKECGERYEYVLHQCGRRWGTNFAKGLEEEWSQFYGTAAQDFPLTLFSNLLVQEFGHNGWGLLSLHIEDATRGIISFSLQGAVMASIAKEDSDTPEDLLLAGIAAGLFSHFLSSELDCIQTQCSRKGHPESRFIISSPARIKAARDLGYKNRSHSDFYNAVLSTSA